MNNKKKQYFVEIAYDLNYHVVLIEDGKIKSHTILASYELSGYENRLREEGYEYTYYVPYYQRKYDEALEELISAKELLEHAKQNPVCVTKDTQEYIDSIL